MTHKEILYKAMKSFPYGDLSSIERAIRIAIEDERAACLQIVADKEREYESRRQNHLQLAASEIKTAIRARSEDK